MKIQEAAVDYAPHYLQVSNHLKVVHDLLKSNNYKDAATFAEQMMVECRLLRTAIKHYAQR
jgi:hypothetical protein